MQKELEKLKKQGFRLTKARLSILEQFVNQGKPLSAGDLLQILPQKSVAADKSTVYRELSFLLEQKIIKEIQLGKNEKKYELSSMPHHHHLVCISCDEVQDIEIKDDLKKEKTLINKLKDFKILDHSLEFFGLCGRCK